MNRLFSTLALGFGVLVLIGFMNTTARADIVLLGPDPCFPAGVGRGCGPAGAPHILSLQNHGSETGGVSFNGSGDVRVGDWSRGSNTQTLSLADVGITQASEAGQLKIYFDVINNGSVTVNSLVLTAFDGNGNAVFSAQLANSLTLPQLGNGQGHSDYAFGLTPDEAAQLAAAIAANPNLRFGLSASISNTDSGPESFFLGRDPAAPVPEPMTILLLGTGLGGVAAAMRKRRKTAPKQ